MSEELVTIEATPRQTRGKEQARKLRRSGRIPGILLDKGQSHAIEFDPKWLHKAMKTEKQFNLSFNGETKRVKIQELQLDHVKRVAIHVDLVYV